MHHKRLQRHELAGHARFLTFSCHRRLSLLRNDAIKSRFVDRFADACAATHVAPLAWVVMPDHVHLVVLPLSDEGTIPRLLHALKKPFAAEVMRRWRTLDAPILTRLVTPTGPRFWQAGGGYDGTVWGRELFEKIRYIHENPVRRDLATRSIDYPWSSARAYEGLDQVDPAIDFTLLPPRDRPVT